jgi:hypothetical protein
MTWLLWRQHRVQLALAAVLLTLFAVPVALTGAHLASALQTCRSSGGCSGGDLFQGYNPIITLVNVTVLVPLVIGVFWGASAVGKELETGTAALVWTQSISRRHWLRAKVLTLLVSATATSAAVSGLVTWWSRTHNATVESRFGGLQFDVQGVAPIAYTVFAAALGLAAGVLWRRVLPAMATTVAGVVVARLGVELFVRPHYRTPITRTVGMGADTGAPPGSLAIRNDLTLNGHVLTGPVRVPDTCAVAARQQMSACMDGLGYRMRTTYQPAGRYWPFQFIEAGIFLGLAALLIAVAILAVRRHDA